MRMLLTAGIEFHHVILPAVDAEVPWRRHPLGAPRTFDRCPRSDWPAASEQEKNWRQPGPRRRLLQVQQGRFSVGECRQVGPDDLVPVTIMSKKRRVLDASNTNLGSARRQRTFISPAHTVPRSRRLRAPADQSPT